MRQRHLYHPYPSERTPLEVIMDLVALIHHFRTHPIDLKWNLIKDIRCGYANWVIPKRLMCGPAPTREMIGDILADGINVFVCLQQENSPATYQPHLPQAIKTFHMPMPDHHAPSRRQLLDNLKTILGQLQEGRNIYIHCAGGHGRTGLYVCCLMACLYAPFSEDDSLSLYYFQSVHDMRKTQIMHFYGILPARVAENACQRQMLSDFLAFVRFATAPLTPQPAAASCYPR